MSERESDFGAFLSGFVLGGLVGAAVALLMAPQTGQETRTVLKDKSIELRDTAYGQADVVRSKASDAVDVAKVKAGEAVGTAKSKATDIQKRSQVVLEEQKERINTAVEAGKKAVKRTPGQDGEETTEA